MVVDPGHGVLEGSAASAASVAGQAAAAAPRRAPTARPSRATEAAQAALRLYSEGHSLPAIAQTLVRPCCAWSCFTGRLLLLSAPFRDTFRYINLLSAISLGTAC